MTPTFSFFKPPIKNTRPYKEQIPLSDVYMVLTGHWYKERTATLRRITKPEANRDFKAANFPFVTFSGVFRYRKEKGLLQHSNLMVFDFDKLSDVEDLKMQLLTDKHFETELLFTSPNGNGLKWLISIDVSRFTHSQWFNAVSRYIAATYHVEVDKSGSDVCRVCFLCFDPDAFMHPRHGKTNRLFPAEVYTTMRQKFNPVQWLHEPEKTKTVAPVPINKTETRKQHEVEVVLRRIEAFQIDLTCEYDDWLRLGFALVNGFGEAGRDYFHRVSMFNPGYQATECDRQFTKCLQAKKTGITLHSFFAAAKDAGINIKV
jgi:hypothetical protein